FSSASPPVCGAARGPRTRDSVEHPHGLRQQWGQLPSALLIVCLALAPASESTSTTTVTAPANDPRDTPVLQRLEVPQGPAPPRTDTRKGRLRRYLTREVARSARHLDHG